MNKKIKTEKKPTPQKKRKRKKKTILVAMSTINIQKSFSKTFPFRMKQEPREEWMSTTETDKV